MKTLTLIAVLAFGPALTGADLEREARALEAMIIAPCCFSQQVSVHQSPAADEVRRDVRARLAAGQTRDQILNAYVSQYGKRILAEPPAAGFDLALYLLPPILLIASAALVIALVRRYSRRPAGPNEATVPMASASYDARLDDELRDLD
jgi:cytochrome c-type biogenesis protein CcmH